MEYKYNIEITHINTRFDNELSKMNSTIRNMKKFWIVLIKDIDKKFPIRLAQQKDTIFNYTISINPLADYNHELH